MSQNPNKGLLSPFTGAYWRAAVQELKNLRVLVLMAVLVAVSLVVSSFYIPVAENLRIYFSFIVSSVAGWIGGPVVALVYGFVTDIIGFVVHPSGGFFLGYTLTSMLGPLFYALFFYRAKLSLLRIFLCKLSVNVFINILLGSVWSAMLYGNGYYFYLAKSTIKNLLLIPIEGVVIALIFSALLPIAVKSGLVPAQQLAFVGRWKSLWGRMRAFGSR